MIQRSLLYCTVSVIFIACSHTTKKSGPDSSEDFTKNIHPSSIQNAKSTKCPQSQNKIKTDLPWKELLKITNQCIKEQRWITVESLGQLQLEQNPHSPWGAYYLSIASEMRGFLTQALWYAELSVRLAPSTPLPHYQLGRLLWNSERRGEAVAHLTKSINLDPSLVSAHLFLGQIYYEERNYSLAQTHLLTAIKYKPTLHKALETLKVVETQKRSDRQPATHRGGNL